MMKKPNIVLIMTDEMRGDCMGIAGHPDVKTPYLDSLGAKGIVFDNAYSACPSCVPARAALHTGMTQRHHRRVGYEDKIQWDYSHTMAGEMAKNGYYTQCVGKMHVHPLRNYLGFHNVELHDGYLHEYRYGDTPYQTSQFVADDYFYWLKNEKGISYDVTDTGLDCNSWMARPWIYEENTHPTNWATTRSIDFLRRKDPRMPFFLMLSYVRPHAPYDAPQYYFDLYKDKKLAPPKYGDWDDREQLEKMGRIFNNSTGPSDPELIRQQQIGYYACITHLDHQIGRLIQALIEHQVYEDTIILFTSDHGEMLSDHCICRKSRAYKGSSKIPMIISGAKEYIGETGVSDSLIELRDVMPTILKLTGAEIPDSVDGFSMLDLRKEENQREYIHGEHTAEQYSSQFIVTKEDKYIWYSQTGIERYFRLDQDPDETENKIFDLQYADRITYLRSRLIQELTGREEGYTDGKGLIVGRKTVNYLTQE